MYQALQVRDQRVDALAAGWDGSASRAAVVTCLSPSAPPQREHWSAYHADSSAPVTKRVMEWRWSRSSTIEIG